MADSLEKGTEHEDEYMISEKELLVNRFDDFGGPHDIFVLTTGLKCDIIISPMFWQVHFGAKRYGSIQLRSLCCRDCKGRISDSHV